MDALRLVAMTATATLLSGCNLFTSKDIGRNTTIENSFPNGYQARGQAPSSSQNPVMPSGIETASATASVSIPAKKSETIVKVVAAIGTDSVITDEEVWHMVRQKPEQYANLAGEARKAKESELFQLELKQLISREMIIADFTARIKKNKPGVVDELQTLSVKEADRSMKILRQNLRVKNDDEFNRILNELGVSERAMHRQYQRNVMVDLFVGPTIREKIKNVGLAELREYYDTHPEDFKLVERAKWVYITTISSRFNTVDEARLYSNWIADQLTQGADFGEMLKKYGMGDSQLRNGEGIGEKPGEIRPSELESTVFSMTKPGQVSRPVESAAGFHVVKLLERDLAGVKKFDEKIQAECRQRIANQIQKKEVERLTEELWRKYRPQIFTQ